MTLLPTPTPAKIRLEKSQRLLVIDWTDGTHSEYAWEILRARCPSADEQAERERQSADPLHVIKKAPSTDVVSIRLVGSYALNIVWADGHSSGIYTWEYLRQLSDI